MAPRKKPNNKPTSSTTGASSKITKSKSSSKSHNATNTDKIIEKGQTKLTGLVGFSRIESPVRRDRKIAEQKEKEKTKPNTRSKDKDKDKQEEEDAFLELLLPNKRPFQLIMDSDEELELDGGKSVARSGASTSVKTVASTSSKDSTVADDNPDDSKQDIDAEPEPIIPTDPAPSTISKKNPTEPKLNALEVFVKKIHDAEYRPTVEDSSTSREKPNADSKWGVEYMINSVPITFPFKAYPSQMAIMSKVFQYLLPSLSN